MGNEQATFTELLDAADEDLTLSRAGELFEQVYMPQRNFSEQTRRGYKGDIRKLIGYLAKVNVTRAGSVKLGHLQAFLADLENRGYDASSRHRKCFSIKAFFGFLASNKLIPGDPSKRLIPPRRRYKEPQPLTPAQTQALLRACSQHPRDNAIINLLLQTGLRLSEVTRLTVYNVELPEKTREQSGGEVHVKRGRKEERFSLNSNATLALRDWLVVRPEISHPALFVTRFRKPMKARSFQLIVEKYARLADIKKASPRRLRQTFDARQLHSIG